MAFVPSVGHALGRPQVAISRRGVCRPRRSGVAAPVVMRSERTSAWRPIASKLASGALRLLIRSLCTRVEELYVDVHATSNMALLTGKLEGVSVTTSRLVYNGVAISGGAALYTDEIVLDLASSSPTLTAVGLADAPLLAKPFSVSIQASFTEADLNRTGPVRESLQLLLREVIRTGLGGAVGRALPAAIGGVTCILDRVELSDRAPDSLFPWSRRHPTDAGGKLVLHAHAELSSGKLINFAVRSGLTTMSDGTIIKLKDPELIWRGINVPIVTIDTIGVQLSDTSKLTSVEIEAGILSADGILVVSPTDTTARITTDQSRTKRGPPPPPQAQTGGRSSLPRGRR